MSTRPAFDAIALPATRDQKGGSSAAWPLMLAAVAAASFVGMDAVIKAMAPRYDALQLAWFRFAGGSVFAVALWAWRRTPLPRGPAGWKQHSLRSVFLLLSLVGYFHALTRLPLVLTVTISYLAPIFIAVLSIPVLGERPSRSIWAALAAGLTGVLMATLPEWNAAASADGSPRIWGMCSAAAAALSFAIVMLLARRQAQRDSVWSILLIQSVLPLLMLTPFAAWHWAPVQTGDVLRALLAGGLGTLGLLCLTQAFTRLEASRAAALDYTSFVWASLLGYLMFGEVPSWSNVASAALIVSGCLLLLRR